MRQGHPGGLLTRTIPALASLFGAALWLCTSVPASAADAPRGATIARGEHIARLVCSACHVVAKDQEYPPILDTPGPTFHDIANRPDTTEKSLRHFITTTHWDMQTIPMTMPNPMLTPEDTRAVARYIVSLRRH